MRVLVADDDKSGAGFIKKAFADHGTVVDLAHDGRTALELARTHPYDILLLDIMMPAMSGFEVLEQLRKEGNKIPVIILSSRGAERDKIKGLDGGADDYVVKPYRLGEIFARVRAVLRRRGPESAVPNFLMSLQYGDLILDLRRHRAELAGRTIELTKKEFELLTYLMEHAGELLTKHTIEAHVWDTDFVRGSDVVAWTIKSLRDKISRPHGPRIETIRGIGYQFTA